MKISVHKSLDSAALVSPTQSSGTHAKTVDEINLACDYLVALKLHGRSPPQSSATQSIGMQRLDRQAPVKVIFVAEDEVSILQLQRSAIGYGHGLKDLLVTRPRNAAFRTISGIGGAPGTSEHDYRERKIS